MELPALDFKNISLCFGDIVANSDISFSVPRGSIHGIVGENGAGKSTAVKILFGIYRPDGGEIFLSGEKVDFGSPVDAMNAKIGMVHQHFMLAGPLTALDNILLHQKGSPFALLPRKRETRRLAGLAQRYGFSIDLTKSIEALSVGEQQRLEILKILSQDSDIIILDEPTAVLTPQETEDLFRNLRRLKDEGKTILIITHKLKEALALTDSITVFRGGKVVATKKTKDTHTEELAEMMVGRRIQKAGERQTNINSSKELLKLTSVSAGVGGQKISEIHLKIHEREIVGIAGVEGNGQDALIRALLDKNSLDKNSLSGDITFSGSLGSFPEDRLRFGLLPGRPVFETFLLGQQRNSTFSRGPFLRLSKVLEKTQETMVKFDIRPNNPNLSVDKLSGGNQQKLVVARALRQNPQVVIAAHPTRGVDIGAIEFIHNQLREARDNGAGILLVSSELEELMTLSDRIVVLYDGHIINEFLREQFDEIAIGTAMGGGH